MLRTLFSSSFALACLSVAAPVTAINDQRLSTIYQFPNETWVENLAIRSNGKILVTLLTAPEVWQVDPERRSAELVARFPNATGALGIGEFEPDVFAVAVGNLSVATVTTVPGSYSAWQIDMRKTERQSDTKANSPGVWKIADMPDANFLNGLAVVPGRRPKILIGDSDKGVIWQVDPRTKNYSVWLQDPAFAPNTSAPVRSGINGLQVHQGYVYFTNSLSTPALGRLPINAKGQPGGPVERIIDQAGWPAPNGDHADDIAVDDDGNVWYATDPSNLLLKIDVRKRTWKVAAGGVDDAAIAGDTSVRIGRGPRDRKTLYIGTNGGIGYPGTTGVQGGKVVAFNTSGLY